jgi:hypothetical protein
MARQLADGSSNGPGPAGWLYPERLPGSRGKRRTRAGPRHSLPRRTVCWRTKKKKTGERKLSHLLSLSTTSLSSFFLSVTSALTLTLSAVIVWETPPAGDRRAGRQTSRWERACTRRGRPEGPSRVRGPAGGGRRRVRAGPPPDPGETQRPRVFFPARGRDAAGLSGCPPPSSEGTLPRGCGTSRQSGGRPCSRFRDVAPAAPWPGSPGRSCIRTRRPTCCSLLDPSGDKPGQRDLPPWPSARTCGAEEGRLFHIV